MRKSIYTTEQAHLQALLREVRVEAGLTQVELAKRLNTVSSHISDYERGERRLDLVQLKAYCEALGLPLLDFVARFAKIISE